MLCKIPLNPTGSSSNSKSLSLSNNLLSIYYVLKELPPFEDIVLSKNIQMLVHWNGISVTVLGRGSSENGELILNKVILQIVLCFTNCRVWMITQWLVCVQSQLEPQYYKNALSIVMEVTEHLQVGAWQFSGTVEPCSTWSHWLVRPDWSNAIRKWLLVRHLPPASNCQSFCCVW